MKKTTILFLATISTASLHGMQPFAPEPICYSQPLPTPDEYIEQGLEHANNNKWLYAEECLVSARNEKPNNYLSNLGLALVALKTNDPDKAIPLLREGIKQIPTNLCSNIESFTDTMLQGLANACQKSRFQENVECAATYNQIKKQKIYKKNNTYHCLYCIYNSKNYTHVLRHLDTHIKKNYPCPKCNKIYHSDGGIRKHKKKCYASKHLVIKFKNQKKSGAVQQPPLPTHQDDDGLDYQ
jgi:hypothetical protein